MRKKILAFCQSHTPLNGTWLISMARYAIHPNTPFELRIFDHQSEQDNVSSMHVWFTEVGVRAAQDLVNLVEADPGWQFQIDEHPNCEFRGPMVASKVFKGEYPGMLLTDSFTDGEFHGQILQVMGMEKIQILPAQQHSFPWNIMYDGESIFALHLCFTGKQEFIQLEEDGSIVLDPKKSFEIRVFDLASNEYESAPLRLEKGTTEHTGTSGNTHGSKYEGYYLCETERKIKYVVFFHWMEDVDGPLEEGIERLFCCEIECDSGRCGRSTCRLDHGDEENPVNHAVQYCDLCGQVFCVTCLAQSQRPKISESIALTSMRCAKCTECFASPPFTLFCVEHFFPNQPAETINQFAVRIVEYVGETYDRMTSVLDDIMCCLDTDYNDPVCYSAIGCDGQAVETADRIPSSAF